MPTKNDLRKTLSFGFEQTFTIENWWTDEGFTATSDTPLKREKMLALARAIADVLGGSFIESVDIWDHMQYETFDDKGKPSFIVTMDPGSIEVKTPPVLFNEVESMAQPLFEAAQKAGVVPYRNWWYGIQGGTEGGCHVNMGGLTQAKNPLKKEPELVVKYSAYIHNRPFLHYPFMGIDVGAEGNAMRMDEKPDYDEVADAFEDYKDIYEDGETLTAAKTYQFFKNTNLIREKASFPSLYKFKAPLYFIEDRAQEALRSAEDFKLVAELRLKILEYLQGQKYPEGLISFGPSLHNEDLTSYSLWADFQYWANEMDVNPVPYQRFFDRQFPKLCKGINPPERFGLKEGRRQRVITDIKKRGDVVVSKNVDTSYKRFELYYYTEKNEDFYFEIEADSIEHKSSIYRHNGFLGFGDAGQAFYEYIDIKYDKDNPVLNIKLKQMGNDKLIEEAKFNINDMQWCE